MSEQNSEKINKLIIPLSIIIAGAIIAGAVYFSAGKSATPIIENNVPVNQQPPQGDTASLDNMAAISASDHIRGDINAAVKIVEYSDTECPFCKQFHSTMKQIIDEYGNDKKVAWVYRHLPLDKLHPKARNEAVAFECANESGGNDKFWAYADRLFEITPSNNGLDPAELPKIAQYIGLDVNKFNTCLSSGKYDKRIQDDSNNAAATGGNGTPWSIVVASNGKKFPLSGAQPYSSVKQLIETALQEK
ncbi:MAG: thioredoxin domain-containing protein [Candidatus Staskawiczbacteria bacterium]|nr:thioredoxin domain-containing protein [Candidatus Staskawiczbacteria bacterium]MBI3337410.1 thioredoxin domain-containing protein [Candidatus Staskawiczbacteria bacterium]